MVAADDPNFSDGEGTTMLSVVDAFRRWPVVEEAPGCSARTLSRARTIVSLASPAKPAAPPSRSPAAGPAASRTTARSGPIAPRSAPGAPPTRSAPSSPGSVCAGRRTRAAARDRPRPPRPASPSTKSPVSPRRRIRPSWPGARCW